MKKYLSFNGKFLLNNTLVAAAGYRLKINGFSQNARFFLLYTFLITLNLGIYNVIFNLYILRLGFKEDFLGLILSLVSISTGLFSIPAAMVCDRIGRKNTLLLSCMLLTISLLFLYTTTSTILLTFSSILYGMSSAFNVVTGSTFLVENSESHERMYLFSMYSILYTLALMIGNSLGGILPKVLTDAFAINPVGPEAYQLSLYMSFFAVFISFLPLMYIKDRRTNYIRNSNQLFTLFSLSRSALIQKMVLVYALIGMGWGTAIPYFNVYFDVVLKTSSDQIGYIFSFSEVITMIALLFVPILTNRFGKVLIVSLVQLSSISFLLIFISSSTLMVAAFAYIMRSALMNMANPIFNSFKLEIVSENQRATVNSLTWMSCYVFFGLSTYIGGLIMARGYYKLPFMLTCVLYAMAAILYYIFFENIEKHKMKMIFPLMSN
jgi:MFS family permease